MNYVIIIIGVISYLLGAVPFAYLVVKKVTGGDITGLGTGNVGAMNSYESTGKKWVGVVVTFLDALKGVAAVLIAFLIDGTFSALAIAGIFAVLGHNFSIFLRFKGGRGLATAAGIALIMNPLVLLFWLLMYILGWNILMKNQNVASVIATIGAPMFVFYTPPVIMNAASFLFDYQVFNFLIFVGFISIIIIIKHIKPISELVKKNTETK